MTSQIKSRNIFDDSVVPLESPKTHFEITRKATILDKPKIKLDMSSPQASGTPPFEDNMSKEGTEGPNLTISDSVCIGDSQTEEVTFNALQQEDSLDAIKLEQQKAKNRSCLEKLEKLNNLLLGNALKNIELYTSHSTFGPKYRESILKKLEIPPTLSAVSPRSKIKQELLKIKTEVGNKLAGSKQTDKRSACADEMDNQSESDKVDTPTVQNQQSEMGQQLEWLQNEILQAKQALSELQADRQELLARKGCLDKKLPQLPPDVDKMKNELAHFKTENRNLQDKLHSVVNEKQNLEIAIEKMSQEIRELLAEKEETNRIRLNEKGRLRDLVEYLEMSIEQWNLQMQWLEESQTSQPE